MNDPKDKSILFILLHAAGSGDGFLTGAAILQKASYNMTAITYH